MQSETKQERVLTTNDLVFKKVFASPQNSHILIGFINDILELGVTEVSVENTYNIRTFYDERKRPYVRYTQVDVLARLSDGRQVTIEMQVCGQKLFKERVLFYVMEIYAANYGKQELENNVGKYAISEKKYSALRPVYSVCVMVENEFSKDGNPIHKFRLHDEKNDIYYENSDEEDLVTMVFLELKKSSNEMKKNIKAWFDYFKTGEVAKEAPLYLQEACRVAKYQNLEKEERDMISARQKAIDGAQAREDYVWDKGVEEGLARGKIELLRTLLSRGKTIQEIADFTGMSEEEIKSMTK